MSAQDSLNAAALAYAASQGWTLPAPTPTPAPTPPSPATVPLFDGRATITKTPFPTTAGLAPNPVVQTPPNPYPVWDGYVFQGSDIRVVDDPRWGKAYLCAPPAGHHNPWNQAAPPSTTAGQISKGRTSDIGRTYWYSESLQVLSSGYVSPGFGTIVSLGYETVQYDQLSLVVYGSLGGVSNVLAIYQNAGLITNGKAALTSVTALKPVTFDAWQDFVIGVTWATDTTGMVEVHYRPGPDGSWSKPYAKSGVPTYVYTQTPPNVPATVLDKEGVYFGWWDQTRTPAPTGQVRLRGLQRWATLADAVASLG